jgi:hypothetical protein
VSLKRDPARIDIDRMSHRQIFVREPMRSNPMAGVDFQSAIETYNYESFTSSESVGKSTEFKNALRAGEEAPGFELPTVEGERVSLAAFRGKKHVLLEFGSIT